MVEYLPLICMAALAALFAVASFWISRLVAPRRPSAAKAAPYECGIVPTREPSDRFPVRFYFVAMIFVIFDIEVIFLYPWAVHFRELGAFGLGEMAVFSAVVIACLAYLLSNGALNWGPSTQGISQEDEIADPMSSIRKVPSRSTSSRPAQPVSSQPVSSQMTRPSRAPLETQE